MYASAAGEPIEDGGDCALVDGDNAVPFVASALQTVAASDKGAEGAKALWAATGLQLSAFLPSFDREDAGKVKEVAQEYGLEAVL